MENRNCKRWHYKLNSACRSNHVAHVRLLTPDCRSHDCESRINELNMVILQTKLQRTYTQATERLENFPLEFSQRENSVAK